MPYGRGGAGNFQALEQDTARAIADIEANHRPAEPMQEVSYTEKRQQQQYAHTGRGGSGNYYSPQELNQTGHWNDIHRSNILGDGTQAPPAAEAAASGGGAGAPPSYNTVRSTVEPTRTVGRGGAGNYMFGVGESEEKAARKRAEEEKKREKVKEVVEQDVQDQLAVPPKAKLSGGEP